MTMTGAMWRPLALAAVLILVTGCGARMTAEERIDLAREQLAQDDASSAAIHLRNVLQEDPANVEARIMLADAAFAVGDYDSAAKEYLRAIDLGGEAGQFRARLVEALVRAGGANEALRHSGDVTAADEPELVFWRASALGRAGRGAEARALFEALAETDAMRERARLGIARLELAARRPEAALAILAPLEAAMTDEADYWEVKAYAALQAGQAENAVAAFRSALEKLVDPLGTRRFMLQAGEAEALLATGALDEARTVASALQAQAEQHPVANYLMARVELQSGDADKALGHAQAVLAAQPESSVGLMMAGAANLMLGQPGQAERYLERAVASQPGNLPARKLLAQTRLGLQSPERALEALGPALTEGGDLSVAALAGLASVRAGDPESAVEILQGQLERAPENDELRAMLAVTLMSAGRTDEALAELALIDAGEGVVRQRADLIAIGAHLQAGDVETARNAAAAVAAAQPGDVALRNTLGALFQGGGRLDAATRWFEESLSLEPGNSVAAYNLGRISVERGDLERAAELFQGALAKNPDNAILLTAMAQLDWARDDRGSAIERLQRAREADPGDGGSRFVLTQYLVAEGRADEAVPVAREAVEIAPAAAPSINALGVALLESGAAAEALPLFAQALEINPVEPRYLLNSARAHLVLGDAEAARTDLVNGLALAPENATFLATLVDVELRTGRLESAAQALGRLEAVLGAEDPRVALLRGQVLLAQERFPAAERAFTEAARLGLEARAAIGLFETRRRGGLPDPAAPLIDWLEKTPDDLVARGLLADHYLAVDDRPAAIREYERLIELQPQNPLFLNNLAWLYGEAGDARAEALGRRAHEQAPGNPMIADTLGWILHQQGDDTAALELLAEAVAGAPQASDVRYRYAVVLAATGDHEAARREARAVLADAGAANYHESAQKLLDGLEGGKE